MGLIWGVTVGIGNGMMAILAAARGERTELPKLSVALPHSSLGARVHLWLQQ